MVFVHCKCACKFAALPRQFLGVLLGNCRISSSADLVYLVVGSEAETAEPGGTLRRVHLERHRPDVWGTQTEQFQQFIGRGHFDWHAGASTNTN